MRVYRFIIFILALCSSHITLGMDEHYNRLASLKGDLDRILNLGDSQVIEINIESNKIKSYFNRRSLWSYARDKTTYISIKSDNNSEKKLVREIIEYIQSNNKKEVFYVFQ